jgi:DHA2 family multidrug resistance protein-like MFS transporter
VGATLVAAGVVAVATLVTDVVVSAVPSHRTGAAAGFVETTTELAGALGIAILGTVLAAVYRGRVLDALPALPAQAQHAAGESLAGALAVAQAGGGRAASLIEAARAAYMDGMHTADLVAAGLLLAAAVLALVTLPARCGARPQQVSGPEEAETAVQP